VAVDVDADVAVAAYDIKVAFTAAPIVGPNA